MTSQNLFSGINDRINLDREDGDYAFFHALMLKLEYVTKIVVSCIVACIGDDVDRNRYSLEHRLVRADSLGTWVEVLNSALIGPPAQSLFPSARDIRRELTEHVVPADWRHRAVIRLNDAAHKLDAGQVLGAKVALRQFFDIGVQLRNRTRGHGATTASQCGHACTDLETALEAIIQDMQVFTLPWVHLHRNISGKFRVSPVLNDPAPFNYLRRTSDVRLPDGVYFHLHDEANVANHVHVPLIFTGPELLDVWLPNGNYKKGSFELLSYVSNDLNRKETAQWSTPPARLPESETEGAATLEQIGNTFANVPPMPTGYVPRVELEERLVKELLTTERHPIVTLTGPGGIGKTTVAIKAIREISQLETPPYEVVLWISARDIDLLDTGPKPVSRHVFTQEDIARAAVELLEPSERTTKTFKPKSYFQRCLEDGAAGSTLFVLDNFETLKDPADVVEWIDAYVRPPNKVLITTRFRDFRGDYPLDIKGMSGEEARRLIDEHSTRLNVSDLISESYKSTLITESDGHPYVIKILLGQVAKEGKAVTPRRIVAAADHLLNALFQRTYDALTPAAQRVFLLLCSWKVYVPEVAVEAVALRPGTERFDVTSALEEGIRFSLVDHSVSEQDDERFVGVPLAAALFGQRELRVSRFKVAVEEDRKLLMDFGAGKRRDAHRGTLPRIEQLLKAVATRASAQPTELEKNLPVLEYLASRFPRAYLKLADLVMEVSDENDSIEQARIYVRRFLETADILDRHQAWRKLAELCRQCNDVMGEVHALCEIALLPTTDHNTLGNVANQLNSRIRDLKHRHIEDAWSVEVRELLTKVIEAMEHQLNNLTATNCSRLAWLHLNVGNPDRALDVARIGAEKDSANYHCQALIDRLETVG